MILIKQYFFLLLKSIGALVFFVSCNNKNQEGARLYQNHCMHCHQESGKGVGKLIPPISKAFMFQHFYDLPCILRNGMAEPTVIDGITYTQKMPGNVQITDVDIVNILNYIEEEFGSGKKDLFTIEMVKEELAKCKNERVVL